VAEAREHAEIAIGLAPENDSILDFHALLMLCIGEFEAARLAANPDRSRDPLTGPDARQALFGAASFHLGLYDESIAAFRKGIESGAPISAATLAYLAAAFQAKGDTDEARRQVQELRRNWPEFRANVTLARLYADPAQAEAVHNLLLDAGWSAR
jgi:tetratricopeptide (TPR) repeat protein